MGRRRLEPSALTRTFSIRLPETQLKLLEHTAVETGLTKNELIRRALTAYLADQPIPAQQIPEQQTGAA